MSRVPLHRFLPCAGAALLALAVVPAAAAPDPPAPPGAAPAGDAAPTPPPAPAGSIAGKLRVLDGDAPLADASGLVVYLEQAPGKLPKVLPVLDIRQKDKTFVPALVVAVVGQKLSFPNDDKIFHNVFSVSRAARFDLGLYKGGETRLVELTRAGVIDVYCNIHPSMAAKIVVLDTPHHAVTDRDGTFRIDGVPPGTWPIVVWQPQGKELRQSVTVEAERVTPLEATLVRDPKDPAHLRKDGTPYGRYH